MPYRTDATNAGLPALTRNFIRAEVLPRLCRQRAGGRAHGETALRLRQEDEYLDSLAAALSDGAENWRPGGDAALRGGHAVPAVLKPRALRLALDARSARGRDHRRALRRALAALCGEAGQHSSTCPAA